MVFTAPFIPLVFQGEEFAASTPFQYFADHDDPEMAKSVSEGRRRKFAAFGWSPDNIPDPEKIETFEGSKLNWSELHEGVHAEMLKWYRGLIHLRRTSSSLSDGDLGHIKVVVDEHKRWLIMDRGRVRVLWNLSDKPAEFENSQHFHLLLASRDDIQVTMDKVLLPPDGLAILCSDSQ
jgi:maltooligosyltrehalose trehalohydrolase